MAEVGPEGLARCCLPQLGCAVPVPSEDRLAVRGSKGSSPDGILMREAVQFLAGGRVPYPRRLVLTGRQEVTAVRAEDDFMDTIGMLQGKRTALARNRVPENDLLG